MQPVKEIITVGILDRAILYNEALMTVLSADPQFDIVFNAADSADALEQLQKIKLNQAPDLFIVAILRNTNYESSLQLVKYIRDNLPGTKSLTLTDDYDVIPAGRFHDAGTSAYLLNTLTVDKFKTALTELNINTTWYDERYKHAGEVREFINTYNNIKLQKNHVESLKLCLANYDCKQTAEKLGLHEQTIKGYTATIRKELKLEDGTDRFFIALHAQRLGLLGKD